MEVITTVTTLPLSFSPIRHILQIRDRQLNAAYLERERYYFIFTNRSFFHLLLCICPPPPHSDHYSLISIQDENCKMRSRYTTITCQSSENGVREARCDGNTSRFQAMTLLFAIPFPFRNQHLLISDPKS